MCESERQSKFLPFFLIVIGILLLQHLWCCFSNQFTNKTFHDTNVWFRAILLPANYQCSNPFYRWIYVVLFFAHWIWFWYILIGSRFFQEKKVCFFFSLFNVNQNKMYNKFFRYSFCSLIFKQNRFNKMNSLYFCWRKNKLNILVKKKHRTLLFYMAIYCYLNDFCVQSCLHHKSIVVKNISNIYFF